MTSSMQTGIYPVKDLESAQTALRPKSRRLPGAANEVPCNV